jgi:hypothetical protein
MRTFNTAYALRVMKALCKGMAIEKLKTLAVDSSDLAT